MLFVKLKGRRLSPLNGAYVMSLVGTATIVYRYIPGDLIEEAVIGGRAGGAFFPFAFFIYCVVGLVRQTNDRPLHVRWSAETSQVRKWLEHGTW